MYYYYFESVVLLWCTTIFALNRLRIYDMHVCMVHGENGIRWPASYLYMAASITILRPRRFFGAQKNDATSFELYSRQLCLFVSY